MDFYQFYGCLFEPQGKMHQEGNGVSLSQSTIQRYPYERLKKVGVKFTMELAKVMPNVTIVVLDGTCGNLIQIQQTAQQ